MNAVAERLHTHAPEAFAIDDLPAHELSPGVTRRRLPSAPGVRVWVVDIAPGAQWPQADHHDTGESFYVVSGEVIEGTHRFGAGTYVTFAPDSRHRPRSERGVRLFGLTVSPPAFLAAGGSLDAIAHSFHPSQG
jgi:mannose-6-phosphate isomerase-like protein (cupin superfamily)